MNVGIYIYNQTEVLDFAGPFEVFSVAARFLDEQKKHNVFLISENNELIMARGGFKLNATYHFKNCPNLDVLIIVGGIHTDELKKDKVIDWIKETSKNAKLIASVCTGAFLLAKANVITNHQVTTHWEDIDDLQNDYPSLKVVKNKRWIDEGNIVTSGGISAGIDMSLHLIRKLYDEELAIKTARQMEFDWTQNF
jgi:transcriptional regulator GlxA family with amidase domain